MKENLDKQCGRASQLELLLCISAGVRGRPERWTPFGAERSTGRDILHGTKSTLMRNVHNHDESPSSPPSSPRVEVLQLREDS